MVVVCDVDNVGWVAPPEGRRRGICGFSPLNQWGDKVGVVTKTCRDGKWRLGGGSVSFYKVRRNGREWKSIIMNEKRFPSNPPLKLQRKSDCTNCQ